ncbi:hypothetical protein L195_g037386 [Trifolium pratense]|uniref:Uncharacterized protein n=1 Tax=Trifolium pratense TaxID=57577 RepID=A0A2K3LS51_TRIPR|nr:hypothetical protein L195_g037386 [Trifolium pratense]
MLEQFENKWKQLAVSLLDRYTIDGLLLSETSKSRQAFIDDTTKNLSAAVGVYETAAELTYSRVTSLEDIINSFSHMPPLLEEKELGKWNELNNRLIWLRLMELEEAELFSIRSNNEVLSKKGSRHKRKLREQTEPPPAGPVYKHWLKPPQTAISNHASLSASRTFLPDQDGDYCYYPH